MRRFLVLLSLLFFSFPVLGQSGSDQLASSISFFPSQENKSVSSSDTIKRLKQQQSELSSLIKLEQSRLLDEDT